MQSRSLWSEAIWGLYFLLAFVMHTNILTTLTDTTAHLLIDIKNRCSFSLQICIDASALSELRSTARAAETVQEKLASVMNAI